MTSAMDLLSFLASDLYEYLDGCKAAGHLPLSMREVLPGEFLDCQHQSEHEQGLQEEVQERRTGRRKEILELALKCEVLDVLEAPGSASCRRK